MPSLPPEIRAYYERNNESQRLTQGVGFLEFLRTQEIARRYLPPSPAVILDVGGGAGVHSLWLARDGHEVHLIDASPNLVEEAQAASDQQPDHPIATCTVGNALQLANHDSSADAVLLMGPLYHLTDRNDRLQALREAHRVLKPNGLLIAAAISRFASILDGFWRSFIDDPKFAAIIDDDLRTGIHRNPTDDIAYFTTAYFHIPDELQTEITGAGLTHEFTFAVEGPTWLLPDLDDHLNDAHKREQLLRGIRSIETEPSLLGSTAHLLAVAHKA
jgi:ubiquinone/menaquinone biosynthesis C-methylase UbiE